MFLIGESVKIDEFNTIGQVVGIEPFVYSCKGVFENIEEWIKNAEIDYYVVFRNVDGIVIKDNFTAKELSKYNDEIDCFSYAKAVAKLVDCIKAKDVDVFAVADVLSCLFDVEHEVVCGILADNLAGV